MSQQHDPVIRTIPRFADLNMNGNIFGGWVLSQMDMAGGIVAARRAKGPVATVAIEAMKFHEPIDVGNLVSVYAHIEKIGKTSLHVRIEVLASPAVEGEEVKVTEGLFIFVALDAKGRPRAVPGGLKL